MITQLSDEGILSLIKETGWSLKRAESLNLISNYRTVARKAEKERTRQVVEWGEETCPHDLFGEGTQCYKHACDMCWQALSKNCNDMGR